MAKKNERVQNQQKQQPTPQPTTPAKPVELTDEALEQVVGGVIAIIKTTAMPDLDAGANA
jgi:hypothetical protein